eukprot:3475685-Ditylum_brightwellii.AAC.1
MKQPIRIAAPTRPHDADRIGANLPFPEEYVSFNFVLTSEVINGSTSLSPMCRHLIFFTLGHIGERSASEFIASQIVD